MTLDVDEKLNYSYKDEEDNVHSEADLDNYSQLEDLNKKYMLCMPGTVKF